MSHQLQDRPSAKDRGPSRSVLLVDDEALVRTAMHRFLARRGWTVSEAVDGDSARTLLDPIAGARGKRLRRRGPCPVKAELDGSWVRFISPRSKLKDFEGTGADHNGSLPGLGAGISEDGKI